MEDSAAAERCLECGAEWTTENGCEDHFHQMLAWEIENPSLGVVHHLLVLCYHLQHPSLYSPDGLEYAKGLLVDFVERGVTTDEVRQRDGSVVDSGRRKFKIRGTRESHGVYARAVGWTITTARVTAGGTELYCDNVRAWARSILESLKSSGNLAT